MSSSQSAFVCRECGEKVTELNVTKFLQEVEEYVDSIGKLEERIFTRKALRSIRFIRRMSHQGANYLYYCKKCALIQSTSAVSRKVVLTPEFVGAN